MNTSLVAQPLASARAYRRAISSYLLPVVRLYEYAFAAGIAVSSHGYRERKLLDMVDAHDQRAVVGLARRSGMVGASTQRISVQLADLLLRWCCNTRDVHLLRAMPKRLVGEKEDKKLEEQTDDLHSKYLEIIKIFHNIANSSAQKRINYIDHVSQHMKLIEKKVREQDAYIKTQAKKLKEAIDKTVSLDGVEEKIESKLLKYLQKEGNKNKKTNRLSQVV